MPRRKMQDPRKLTLRLEGEVIDAAKAFAEERGTSLSEMVERYFRGVAMRPHQRAHEEKVRYGSDSDTEEGDEPEWWQHVHPSVRAHLRALYRGEDPEAAAAAVPAEAKAAWLDSLSPNVRALIGIAKPRPGEPEVTKEEYYRYLDEKHR